MTKRQDARNMGMMDGRAGLRYATSGKPGWDAGSCRAYEKGFAVGKECRLEGERNVTRRRRAAEGEAVGHEGHQHRICHDCDRKWYGTSRVCPTCRGYNTGIDDRIQR